MQVIAKIKDLNSDKSKQVILRNLSRILDVRVLEVDIDSKTVSLIYDSILAFENAKEEFKRIGFPIVKYFSQSAEKHTS